MTDRIGPTFSDELRAANLVASCIFFADGALLFPDDASDATKAAVQSVLAAHDPTKQIVPDGPSLSDWRTAVLLWGRLDQVDAAIAALKGQSDPAKSMLGKVAEQRFQFANNVFRTQLLSFKDALGFTAADVDESLWRAGQVAKGDLSGKWPPPSS